MHRLRIEFGGEGDDLLARHPPRAVDGDRAGLEVFPVELRHGGFLLSFRGPRKAASRNAEEISGRKAEMHYVAVGDHVILAFQAHLAGLFSAGLAALGDEIVIGDGFGADEPALEIRMDDAGGLRRLGALA